MLRWRMPDAAEPKKIIAPFGKEQLGSRPKFWYRVAGDNQPWLFKYTREHTGEDWSEKIASEVAKLLGVPAAGLNWPSSWKSGDHA
jgi:hypothetical protein